MENSKNKNKPSEKQAVNSRIIPATVLSKNELPNKTKGKHIAPEIHLNDKQEAKLTKLVPPEDSNSSQRSLVTGENVYKPTKKQRLFLQTALQSNKHEIKTISDTAGLSRGAWYHWIKKPEFVKWYNESWQKALDASAWKLDAMGLNKASEDHKYWKSMQQRSGRLVEGNQQNTQINIAGLAVDFIED